MNYEIVPRDLDSLIITDLLLARTHGCKHCQTHGFTLKQN